MDAIRKFWEFLKKDTLPSWIVSLLLIFVLIKFILFPLLSLVSGTELPLVVVESCSMHHETEFDSWWDQNGLWYESQSITKEEFNEFTLKNGFTKGDIIIVRGPEDIEVGDTIIFLAGTRYPVIHRVMDTSPLSTKGDNNLEQLEVERAIDEDRVLGKAVGKIPLLGWVKLIFFEPARNPVDRGVC